MSETITFTVPVFDSKEMEEVAFEVCTPVMTPRDILEQATEYLREHWVAGHWFVYTDGRTEDQRAGDSNSALIHQPEQISKACSVGAMLLAKQMQGAQRLGEALWDRVGDNDPAFHQAVTLLVRQIADDDDLRDWDGYEDWAELPTGELITLVTNWNDMDDRYRDEVINAFVAATKGAIKEEEAGAR